LSLKDRPDRRALPPLVHALRYYSFDVALDFIVFPLTRHFVGGVQSSPSNDSL
jgi:hypothetical protein